MRTIDEIRVDIDKIDDQLKDLFLKRMDLIDEVKECKKFYKLSFEDAKRESSIIDRLSSPLDKHYEELILFVKNLFSISKGTYNKK